MELRTMNHGVLANHLRRHADATRGYHTSTEMQIANGLGMIYFTCANRRAANTARNIIAARGTPVGKFIVPDTMPGYEFTLTAVKKFEGSYTFAYGYEGF